MQLLDYLLDNQLDIDLSKHSMDTYNYIVQERQNNRYIDSATEINALATNIHIFAISFESKDKNTKDLCHQKDYYNSEQKNPSFLNKYPKKRCKLGVA